MSVSNQEIHINIDAQQQDGLKMLAAASGLSLQALKKCMHKGAVWLTRGKQTQRLRRAKKSYLVGDALHLYYNENVLNEIVPPAELLFDEGDYSLWYKPYGMRCQGSKWSDHTTINRFVENQTTPSRPAYIVHRLDRAATGLIIIAHSKKMAAALAKLFALRTLKKYYHVIVEGDIEKSPLFSPSLDASTAEKQLTINTPVDNKNAISHVEQLEYCQESDQSLVKITIETGRKHQIRVHMASIGHPVIGDRLHGNADINSIDLQLTSCFFEFICPISHQRTQFMLPERLRPSLK
ncbi:pseudouridine synthase family protein [Shewanella surugensis]|uniref:RluA family pseudouridine synthase n=1 Tax=Shewanella surugensis TaxID=212020 RepID=A0ABT0LJ34_9GAMM|nr:RluA family pseudouridine synthase [Shewanella surugensis]MCL1127470.1 RluA family pseudouridine synthase [Shewanella surugensis]